MGSVVLKSLSVLLGIFFVFVGTMKMSSLISKELHKDLVRIGMANCSFITIVSSYCAPGYEVH